MISAGDFRNGITIELDNNIFQIVEFQHVKPGKGAAFVRTKLKNIKSGGVVEKTFRQKNARRHGLTERTCSIYIPTAICSISWMSRHTIRLRSIRIQSVMR